MKLKIKVGSWIGALCFIAIQLAFAGDSPQVAALGIGPDRIRATVATDPAVIKYGRDVSNAMERAWRWFWKELGPPPTKEEDLERYNLEKIANRRFLLDRARAAPIVRNWELEKVVELAAARFDYFIDAMERLQADSSVKILMEPEEADDKRNFIPSALVARILAFREMQFAYLELQKYQGWSPRLEKIASKFAWFGSLMNMLLPPKFMIAAGAIVFSYFSYGHSDSQLSDLGWGGIIGSGLGFACSQIISELPQGVVNWWVMPTLNSRRAPLFTNGVFNRAFSSDAAKAYRDRILNTKHQN